jgi:N-methylhydantoinase B
VKHQEQPRYAGSGHDEVDWATLEGGPWDGTRFSYVPPARLRIDPALPLHQVFATDIDPVTYQVLRSRFWNMNLDHSDTVKRVSGSPVIVYMEDFNTSLLTEDGASVVCGPSIQYFTGYGDLVVKWTLENRSANPGIEDGDIFLQNDPYVGTAHQIDVQLYTPVFWEGKLFCWVFGNCHVGDIGGINPGSFVPEAPDIYSEPIPIPPLKIARRDVIQQDVLGMFVRQSRTPEKLTLQLRSQVAGLRTTRARMLELLAEHGAPLVKGVMRRMIADCSRAVGERLRLLPDGRWSESMLIGSAAPHDRRAHRLVTTVHKRGDRMIFDNRGTDPQFFAANGTYGSWRSALICAAGTLLAHDQMYCPAGVLEHMQLQPTPGTLNCASYPAAVTPLASTIVSVYLASQVLSKMLAAGPDELRRRANATGGVALPGWWVASGIDRSGRFVADVTGDQVMGAIGAFATRDGIDTGGAWWWPRSTAGNVEDWEQAVPFLYLYRREQRDSGGPGRFRGGNGVELAITPHKTGQLTAQVISVDPGVITTLGLEGGHPGHPGNFIAVPGALGAVGEERSAHWRTSREALAAAAGPLRRASPKAVVVMRPGDVWVVENSAGGGLGDPLAREPEQVAADVRAGAVSSAAALAHYGVALRADGGVDEVSTAAERERALRARLSAAAPAARAHDGRRLAGARRVTGTLGVGIQGGVETWACLGCETALGTATVAYKQFARIVETPPQHVDPVMYADPSEYCDDPIVLRRFHCPVCAALWATEVCRATDPPLDDARPGAHDDAATGGIAARRQA